MNKIFASLLCYSLTLPLLVSATSGSAPSSKKHTRASLAQSAKADTPANNRSSKGDNVLTNAPKTTNTKSTSSAPRPQVVLTASAEDLPESTETCEREECEPGPNHFRFSTSHTENKGIGYNQGYTSLDMFFNWVPIYNLYPFFDLRGHVSNDGNPSANFGAGVRYLPEKLNAVFGLNLFYDFRQARHASFQQLGCGIEILGTQWKFNANGYLPIIQSSYITNKHFSQFSGHKALLHINREIAMKGGDANLGRSLIHRGFYSLDAYLGGYYFKGHRNLDAPGGYCRLTSSLSRFVSLEVQGSYDPLFKTIIQGTVGLNFPVGKRIKSPSTERSCYQKIALERNLTDPVSRFEMIVTHLNQQITDALDPRTMDPLHIVFVDQTARDPGDGTAEQPYRLLAQAESYAQESDMIYVYGRNLLTYTDPITLKNNQWMQGSAMSFQAFSAYGPVQIPAQTSSIPQIIPILATPTVTLASHNIVQGFGIGALGDAISGNSVYDATINNNIFLGGLPGVSAICLFTDPQGTINIKNNQGFGAQGIVITASTPFDLNIKNNEFSNTRTNIDLTLQTSCNATILIENNLLQNADRGILVTERIGARGCMDILENVISSAQSTLDITSSGILNVNLGNNTLASTDDRFPMGTTYFELSDHSITHLTLENNTYQNIDYGIDLYASDNASIWTYINQNKSSHGTFLNSLIEDSAILTSYIYNNHITSNTGSDCMTMGFSGTENSAVTLSNNRGTSPDQGVNMQNEATARVMVNLTNNTMKVSGIGYSLSNTGTGRMLLQSPNLQLSGVQAINQGLIEPVDVTYTIYNSPPINP